MTLPLLPLPDSEPDVDPDGLSVRAGRLSFCFCDCFFFFGCAGCERLAFGLGVEVEEVAAAAAAASFEVVGSVGLEGFVLGFGLVEVMEGPAALALGDARLGGLKGRRRLFWGGCRSGGIATDSRRNKCYVGREPYSED